MSEDIELVTGPDSRLLLREWENAHGRRMVTVAPQYLDRSGTWKLSHNGLILAPDTARELAPGEGGNMHVQAVKVGFKRWVEAQTRGNSTHT